MSASSASSKHGGKSKNPKKSKALNAPKSREASATMEIDIPAFTFDAALQTFLNPPLTREIVKMPSVTTWEKIANDENSPYSAMATRIAEYLDITPNPVLPDIHVVSDVHLFAGTKQRAGYEYFTHIIEEAERNGVSIDKLGVYIVSTPHGYGQIALAFLTKLFGIKCRIYIGAEGPRTEYTKRAAALGAEIREIHAHDLHRDKCALQKSKFKPIVDGEILVRESEEFGDNFFDDTYAKATKDAEHIKVIRDFVVIQKHRNHLRLHTLKTICAQEMMFAGDGWVQIPFGFDSEEFTTALSSSIASVNNSSFESIPVDSPIELWITAGSGMVAEALSKVFPRADMHLLQVGAKISTEKIDKIQANVENGNDSVTIHQSGRVFSVPVPSQEMPPYETAVPAYDAKLWIACCADVMIRIMDGRAPTSPIYLWSVA